MSKRMSLVEATARRKEEFVKAAAIRSTARPADAHRGGGVGGLQGGRVARASGGAARSVGLARTGGGVVALKVRATANEAQAHKEHARVNTNFYRLHFSPNAKSVCGKSFLQNQA